MRDDEIRRLLREMNPWWRLRGSEDRRAWTAQDPALRGAASLGIDYRPDVLTDVVDGGLYVVRGPRRVGKSVALKRHAEDLLGRRGTDPFDLVHLALDGFEARDLRRALRLGRELTAAAGERPRTWLLDEITAVTGWADILKSDRDNTALAGDTVIVTGSSAHGLDEARRTLGAGRTGPAARPFRLLLPMSFRDFCRVTGRDVPAIPAVGPADLMSDQAMDGLQLLVPFVDTLDLAWQSYLEAGGFPRAVGEQAAAGAVSPVFLGDLVSWLAPEVTPDEGTESVLRLLDAVTRRSTSPLNVVATAGTLGTTRERLRGRLNRLLGTFAALSCPQVDDRGAAVAGSQAKVYLSDPLLMRLAHLVDPGFADPDAGAVSEAAVATAVARSVELLHPGRLVEGRAVAYARTGGGNEVDFAPLPVRVAGRDVLTVPVESKWVSGGWRSAALTIENRYGHGVLATKDILDTGHSTWAVPAGALALLLG